VADFDLDMDELRRFAAELEAAGPAVVPKVNGALTRHANRVAARARDFAPKDRPWLATTEGITVRADGRFTRRIGTGADPRGKPVGFMVEYGTSKMAPRPFMRRALADVGPDFVSDLEHILYEAL